MRIFMIAGVLALIAAAPVSAATTVQDCTGPDCASPGGHQCERQKETPTV